MGTKAMGLSDDPSDSLSISRELVQKTPLVVDLDGALLRSDLSVESAFAYLGRGPVRFCKLVEALVHGKAALKSYIAATTVIDASHLPYDEEVLNLVQNAAASGRPIFISSASNERYVQAVGRHLGLFNGCFASSDAENLSGATKARRLVEAFGEGGFDYLGNAAADYPVWTVARRRMVARASSRVRAKLVALDAETTFLAPAVGKKAIWLRLLRTHQWAKNMLVLVPLVTAQRFDLSAFGGAVLAFFAFSLAASGIYIVNDLVDLDADRNHPSKRHRPLAEGTISVRHAVLVAPMLIAVALILAVLVTPEFSLVLLAYLALTTAYTFILKRKMMIDVVSLAVLYTLRVVGGAAAIAVPVSEWLIGFSIFIFTSLALIKRYTELAVRLDADLPDPTNRNYRKSDLSNIAALAAAAAFNSVTVFAIYISSETVHRLYHHPAVLWLICPILMYWLGRILMLAHRRAIDDDPIVFALRDRNSLVAFGLIAAILVGAI
jgi:4-hydroxybenzoate polyprenyltransferase